MRPAFSVILLTTLVGAGQGLFLALYAVDLAGRIEMLDPPEAVFMVAGGLIAGTLTLLGLAASFFHLGHPERAWRSAAMWRTSWLSREVIVLPAFIGAAFMYGLANHFRWGLLPFIGVLTLLACVALFLCTAMIYMSLKFLQEWASALTLVNFILLGAASGFTLAVPLASVLAPNLVEFYAVAAISLTLGALASRGASLVRNARLKPKSSVQSATGLKGHVVQRSQGFTAGSFNTKEFFHGRTRRALALVKWGFLVAVFPVPLVFLAAGLVFDELWLFIAAFVVQYAGLIAERWFFFAQANHPQNIYYQAIS